MFNVGDTVEYIGRRLPFGKDLTVLKVIPNPHFKGGGWCRVLEYPNTAVSWGNLRRVPFTLENE